MDYVNGGISSSYTIPIQPVKASSPTNLDRDDVGLSLNGVAIAPPAPVDAILGAYTIAVFDDCAGHINPVAGYHYHGSAGCSEIVTEHDGHHTAQAWKACETKSVGATCNYIMQTDQLYKGSCRQMTQALMCVRNQPILTLSIEELKKLDKVNSN